MAIFVLGEYQAMLQADRADSASKSAMEAVGATRASLRAATHRAAWVEQRGWYARAYFGSDGIGGDSGWLGRGPNAFWLEPNAWALLSGLTDEHNTTQRVLANVNTLSRANSRTGGGDPVFRRRCGANRPS